MSAAAPALKPKPAPKSEPFTKLPHWFFEHLPRITYSQTEIWMVLWVWRMTEGKERKVGEQAPFWTPITPAREIARICHCTEKAVEDTGKKICWDEGTEAPGRGLLLRKKIGRSYIYHCRIEAWEMIEGRCIPEETPKKPPQSADSAAEPTDIEDEQKGNNSPTELRVWEHPREFKGKDRRGPREELPHAAKYVRPEARNCTIDLILKGEELRIVVFGTANEISSSKGHIKDGLNGHSPPQASPNQRHGPASPGFQSFLALAIEAGFRTTEVLIAKAERMFIRLPINEQLAANRGLKAQIEAGDYPNPSHPKQIDRYVEDKMWQATPRARPRTNAQQASDENKQRARQIAAAIDREKGWAI